MGKRSSFERVERDFYPTPLEAVIPLSPHVAKNSTFIEPCAGNGVLINHLKSIGLDPVWAFDIEPQESVCKWYPKIGKHDALKLTQEDVDELGDFAVQRYIITNPPWDRKILHPMIECFRNLLPTWLLFDADWAHTKQASEYLKYCSNIVSIGRVKWIPDSKMTGKDNCAWYLFNKDPQEIVFYGRTS